MGANAWCPVGSPGLLNVQLNDNDDTAAVVADGRAVTLSGGPGNDTLSGANARLNAAGGPGDDSLAGAGPNADMLAGDDGDDFFTNVLGPDAVDGGAGVDTVSYAGQPAALAVSLDDQANDGVGAVADIRSSVENVIGGSAADTLAGSQARNRLEGGAGNDVLRGNGGVDVLLGGDGDDTIEASDGTADSVDCGPGNDTARVDRADTVTGCERVILADDGGSGAAPSPATPGATGPVDRPGDGTKPPAGRLPRVTSPITYAWEARARTTRVVRLVVRDVPEGGWVEVRCAGRGCPLRNRTVRPKRGRAQLAPMFPRRGLPAGTVLEIRVLAPEHIGKVRRYTMRAGKLPAARSECLPPGASKPRHC
jgi:hypothetical protein